MLAKYSIGSYRRRRKEVTMILTTEVGELGPVGKESSYQKSRYIKTEKISLTKVASGKKINILISSNGIYLKHL